MRSIGVRFLKQKPQLVDVDASVQQVVQLLKKQKQVELVAKQGQINRVGMITKRIEQQANCKIKSMLSSTSLQTVTDQRGDKRQQQVLSIKIIFVK